MSPRHRRSLFREVNESIRAVSSGFTIAPAMLELLCECEQEECVKRISVPAGAYAAARGGGGQFVVAPGHEVTSDRVVGGNDVFTVVSSSTRADRHLRVA